MGPGLIPRPVVSLIAAVVIIVWGASQLAIIFVPTYEAPAEIHLAVMLVLGALFGLRRDDKDEQRPSESGEKPPAEPPPEGRVSAADLINRLKQEPPPERRRDRR